MPFEVKVRSMLDDNGSFLQPEQHAITCRIIVVVDQCDMIGGSEQSDLTLSKNQCRRNKWGPDTTTTTAEHSLYLLKDFKLIHQQPLKFANGFYLSSNYWRDINEEQKNSWRKTHLLLGFYNAAGDNPNYVNREDLKNAIDAVVDENPSEKQMSDAIAYFRVNHKLISLDDFRSFSTCGKQHPTHTGRHWVAVSLSEVVVYCMSKKNTLLHFKMPTLKLLLNMADWKQYVYCLSNSTVGDADDKQFNNKR